MLTIEMLRRRWPAGNQHIPGLIEGIVASSLRVFGSYGIANKPMAIAHFMAQASEESGQGLEMIESLNYTAQRLRVIFPTHFTPAMVQRWAHNERMIGEIAYGGRMGNAPPPSSDGFDFRGAGLTQVTGRDGVAALQKLLDVHGAGFSVLEDPELIIDEPRTGGWSVPRSRPPEMEDLERHLPTFHGVEHAVDDAGPPLAEGLDEPVAERDGREGRGSGVGDHRSQVSHVEVA